MLGDVFRFIVRIQFALFCLLLAACAAFETGVQSEPVAAGSEPLSTVAAPEQNPTEPATTTLPATNTPELLATETAAPESVPTEVEPIETPTAATASTVYAEGLAQTLALPACYDFDYGVSVVPPDPACDFNILPGPDGGTIEVYPVQTARLAYGGVFPEPPTFAQCAENDAYSAEREIVAPMAAMYVCYRTAEGRTGYLHFTGADLQQAGTVTFDWLTFSKESDGSGTATSALDLSYSHDTFGFRLAMPETWAGYQTSERTYTEDSSPEVVTICFYFTASQRLPLCILKIDVWTRAAWNNRETIPDGYYLAENGEYVFAAGPHDSQCVQLDEFQCERQREVPAILATFSTE